MSLSVSDIAVSKAFYEKLDFVVTGGDQEQKWLILKNGTTIIGLFEGMFDKNILTFNPGWNNDAQELDEFTDVRELQKALTKHNVEFESKVDEESVGPASFVIHHLDGNPILVDQHK